MSPKNRVILGLMTFGPDEASGARITSLDDYGQCLDYLQSQGYNEIDTAAMYIGGKQEAFTREARWKERGLKIATKCYPTEAGMHKKDRLPGYCETSLKNLGADCVDIYYLHAADRSVDFEETMEACNTLHKAGKFVELGLSNFAAWEVAECVTLCRKNGWVQPTIYQAMYNCITRSIEPELIPCCRKYGIKLVVYNPLAGGLFSGKYTVESLKNPPPDAGRYSDSNYLGKMYRDRYFKPEILRCLELVEPVAKTHELSLLEIALRWVVNHSQLKIEGDSGDGVIIGVSSFNQLKGNLANLEKGPLPEDVVKALDEAWLACKASAPLYWR